MIQTRHLLPLSLLALVAAIVFASDASAQRPPAGGDGQPSLLGQYGDWGAYTGASGGRKVCFALAKPGTSQTNPPNRPRDPTYVFISTRPADNVRNEVSVIIGYPFRPGSDAQAEIDNTPYPLYTQGDGAWVKNAGDEARVVDAIRKGSTMVVTGVSGRGTETTDRYSLKGVSQAIDRIEQECR